MTGAPATLKDTNGVPLSVGQTVRQVGVYDPSKGALYDNARRFGRVVKIGRTRAHVDFGRTKVVGWQRTSEPIIDRIAPELLVVQKTEAGA